MAQNPEGGHEYECNMCGQTFDSEEQLQTHAEEEHEMEI